MRGVRFSLLLHRLRLGLVVLVFVATTALVVQAQTLGRTLRSGLGLGFGSRLGSGFELGYPQKPLILTGDTTTTTISGAPENVDVVNSPPGDARVSASCTACEVCFTLCMFLSHPIGGCVTKLVNFV
jgi:hypothetical protein